MNAAPDTRIETRAKELASEDLRRLHCHTDRLFLVLLMLQWLGGIVAALFITPRTWIGRESTLHVHMWSAVILGGVIVSAPVVMAWARPGTRATRYVIAIAQMCFASLLIHLTGGRIETHFLIFVSIAFLAFYRDYGILFAATAVVAVDHLFRGLFWPESVFGTLLASNWRWAEHAGWVLFEDLIVCLSIRRAISEAMLSSSRQAEVEFAKAGIEETVEKRTRELELARREAESADRCKSDFLANMSHEIRTPMTAILGYADLLENGDQFRQDPEHAAEAVQTIRRNARYLLTIINDILDVSKIEAGKMTVESIDTNPIQIVEEVVSLLQPRARSKQIEVRIRYDTPIPRRITSDPTRLRQIVLNLTSNAIKFTEQGMVTLRLSCSPAAQSLRIAFEDTGIGLTPEQREQVEKMQAFTQADGSTSRRFGGTGLGLRICGALTELLGGSIEIESEFGKGSRFILSIATGDLAGVEFLSQAEVPHPYQILDLAGNVPETDVSDVPPLQGVRILLAEDGIDNQRLISYLLISAGAEIHVVNNGRSAVEAFLADVDAQAPFSLVLMDMQMPEMDGYEAAKSIRRSGRTTPIVALTAHAMHGDREVCLAAGCDEYLTKPIDRAQLIAMCARMAALSRSRDAA